MRVPHPIPYQGSKRNIAPDIMRYFPDSIATLIEPFAGSAALSLAAAQHNRAQQFLFNDINTPLMSLWRSIIHTPDNLAKYYERLWRAQLGRERQFYDLVRTRFNVSPQPYYLLYLLARCVKASVRYNTNGEFNQSPDNRRKGRNPKAMRRDIQRAASLLRGRISLTACDYWAVLKLATPADLVYMDPPYQGVSVTGDPRYIKGLDFDIFVGHLYQLNARNISYILSYDGRTGGKRFGRPLPEPLNLHLIEINAGRSSQATLLGKQAITYESLYLSPALQKRLTNTGPHRDSFLQQLPLFGELA